MNPRTGRGMQNAPGRMIAPGAFFSRKRIAVAGYSLFPIPYSLFPAPYSLLPIPYSLFPAVPQPSNRRNARHTLCPPKPNELLSATRTGRSIIPSVP
jgi:hypothetical protein